MHPETPPSGRPRRILFQLVPEAKSGKNRVHLDVAVGADRVEAELERLTAKGTAFQPTTARRSAGWRCPWSGIRSTVDAPAGPNPSSPVAMPHAPPRHGHDQDDAARP